MKKCSKCGEEKELSEFYKSKNAKDGLGTYCKECSRNRSKKYDSRPEVKLKKKERNKEYKREYNSRPKVKLKRKEYNSRPKVKLKRKEYQRNKIEKNPLLKLIKNTRRRTSHAFTNKNYTKNSRTHELLKCSWTELESHIEKQFTEGMTWNNISEWQVDHMIPLGCAVNEKEVTILCHHKNLQPLWTKENIKKSDKILPQYAELWKELGLKREFIPTKQF